jgi:chromatin remodeling complex protein RSC6
MLKYIDAIAGHPSVVRSRDVNSPTQLRELSGVYPWVSARIEQATTEQAMARSAEKRGEDETAAAAKKVKATGKPAGGARGGITAPVTPSDDLAQIVGKDDLPRSEVVSKVWAYIKKNDLQDAKDRRKINADDKLGKVFGKKSSDMFEMNKHLSRHLTAKKG